jgi:N6-adenosine-specific RNA methylase IME4
MKSPLLTHDGVSLSDDRMVVRDLAVLVSHGLRFATILADPPWEYDQSPRGAARNHYPTMSLSALKAMPVAQLAHPNCHLHLWATHSFLQEAHELMTAWGFEYRSLFIWVKPQLGMGHYWRSSGEFLLLGVRGRLPFREKSIPNWACVPRSGHSEKPEIFRDLIERVSPAPRLELFGRKAVPGWTVFGDQIPTRNGCSEPDLFATDADTAGEAQ